MNIRERAIHLVLIWMKTVGGEGDSLKVKRVCKREIRVLTLLWEGLKKKLARQVR